MNTSILIPLDNDAGDGFSWYEADRVRLPVLPVPGVVVVVDGVRRPVESVDVHVDPEPWCEVRCGHPYPDVP